MRISLHMQLKRIKKSSKFPPKQSDEVEKRKVPQVLSRESSSPGEREKKNSFKTANPFYLPNISLQFSVKRKVADQKANFRRESQKWEGISYLNKNCFLSLLERKKKNCKEPSVHYFWISNSREIGGSGCWWKINRIFNVSRESLHNELWDFVTEKSFKKTNMILSLITLF